MSTTLGDPIETGCEGFLAFLEPPLAWLVFNNPERRNAVTYEMWQAIPPTLEGIARNVQVRAVILTGSGNKAFVSGADISQFKRLRSNLSDNDAYRRESNAAFKALATFEKPTIAMIQGACIGGGLSVALACDLRIATDESRFGVPAARLGLGYTFDGVERLVQHVGPAFAREILITARHFSATEALTMGLVNHVVPPAEIEAEARRYGHMIAANAPLTIHACKLALRELEKPGGERDMERISHAIRACFTSEDYKEGQLAFAEKRRPRFIGR